MTKSFTIQLSTEDRAKLLNALESNNYFVLYINGIEVHILRACEGSNSAVQIKEHFEVGQRRNIET